MTFGISNNVKSRIVRTCTPELFLKAVDSPVVARLCAEIEDALEAVRRGEMEREEYDTLKANRKKMLPVITPHATFRNGRRLNADAIPSGLSMYDVDHIPDPRGYYESRLRGREKELGIVLAHVTPSLEGLRLLFVVPELGMTLEAAQHWMSERLNDTDYDGAVKDLARCSFLVPRDYILYMDEQGLFAPDTITNKINTSENKGEEKNEKKKSKDSVVADAVADTMDIPAAGKNINRSKVDLEETKNAPADATREESVHEDHEVNLCFKSIPYKTIIQEWFRIMGGEPQKGERNTKLHKLAVHLRYITDNNESLILRIMPRFDLPEEEMRGLIHSACTAPFYSTPKEMQQAIDDAGKLIFSQSGVGGDDVREALPPPMPQKLPSLIRLLLSRTPEVYKPAVAHAVFPPLATHLHRVRFRYIDNVAHEATLMCVLMAGTGAGKDCITEPINRIMADIRRRDEDNLRREREWKNEINSKGANKDKRARPEGLIIQEIDADMTNPAFVMRTSEADGHFLYTKLNEIDQFDALRGSGRGGQQYRIMCLAFDPGNRYGQTRVGSQSVTEVVCIRFNWNATTTISKGKRYFSQVLTDGPISRINFCTIPEREIGADMPVYGEYDAAFDEAIRPYIENLTKATGEVNCPEAFRLTKKLREECADFARLSQSRVYENLSFRATVIAYLKACVLYIAQGYRWDKTIEEFIRWSLEYDMWCKMEFFGADIEDAMKDTMNGRKKYGRTNLLTLLPESFSKADAIRVRQSQGLDANGVDSMLRQWKCRHYITMTNDQYKKNKIEWK